MQVAVLGAGMLGTCVSLELAKRGIQVDLYDREDACITQAGGRNEGKLHLGFVYGADPSFRTADKMVSGALQFYPLLRRWVGQELDAVAVSSPFIYAIEHGSLLSVQQSEEYFLRLEKKILDYGPSEYPGGALQKVEKLSDSECNRWFNSERFLAAYRTPERSIEVRKLALILRNKVNESELISFNPRSELNGVSVQENQVEVEYTTFGERKKRSYDAVINTLWDGRLALDQQVGLSDEAPWTYRLKHAIFLRSGGHSDIPSVTIVQGAYGDIVNFGQGSYYLSWYPVCKQGFAKNVISPPDWDRNLRRKAAERLTIDTIENLAQYVPGLRNMTMENIQDLFVLGGVIYAHGETDVTDPESGLHNRFQPAIKSKGSYYSVNPGKYTLCPYFAYQVAGQICPAPAASASVS